MGLKNKKKETFVRLSLAVVAGDCRLVADLVSIWYDDTDNQ